MVEHGKPDDPTPQRARRRASRWWIAGAAVFLPLLVLLAFQYRWLRDLEKATSVARVTVLENYLGALAKEVEHFYVRGAERTLNVPGGLFREDCLGQVASFFQRGEASGVKRLFIVTYLGEFPGSVYFYEPEACSMGLVTAGPEADAVYLAAAVWQDEAPASTVLAAGFATSELDPQNRVVMKPVYGTSSELVGLAGMILDATYFEREVLPAAIEASLPKLSGRDEVLVTVKNGEGRIVLPTGGVERRPNEVERALPFVFTDWRVGLQTPYASPERWARANFLMNVSLSVLLALVLLGGVTLALRMAARELKLSEMKNDFVSNVSHELRTPLASIRAFGELMRRGRVREAAKVREFGEYIENESRRLTHLVDNILDVSRIESGRRIYRFETADLTAVVAQAVHTFAVGRGVEIDFEPPAHPLPILRLDTDAIVQALSNLLENGVKYAGDDPPSIAVLLAFEAAPPGNGAAPERVVLSVTDRGVGIARSEHEAIFERFYRVSTGLVHDVKGSGLGLAIVRHVAEAHGGEVTIESEPGRGSTFRVHLPIRGVRLAPPAAARPNLPAAAPEPELG